MTIRKPNWLRMTNRGLGGLALLFGFPGLISVIVIFAARQGDVFTRLLGYLFEQYYSIMSRNIYLFSLGLGLSILTLTVGLLTTMIVKDKDDKKLGLYSIGFGTLGIIGIRVAQLILRMAQE